MFPPPPARGWSGPGRRGQRREGDVGEGAARHRRVPLSSRWRNLRGRSVCEGHPRRPDWRGRTRNYRGSPPLPAPFCCRDPRVCPVPAGCVPRGTVADRRTLRARSGLRGRFKLLRLQPSSELAGPRVLIGVNSHQLPARESGTASRKKKGKSGGQAICWKLKRKSGEEVEAGPGFPASHSCTSIPGTLHLPLQ